MNEFVFPKRTCYKCKEEKITCMHFSPASNLCNECRKKHQDQYSKKHLMRDSRNRWNACSADRKPRTGWRDIYG